MNEDDFEEILRIQQMMSKRILAEQKVNKKVDVLSVINELTRGGKKPVQVEAIILECQNIGLTEDSVSSILEELEKESIIKIKSSIVYQL